MCPVSARVLPLQGKDVLNDLYVMVIHITLSNKIVVSLCMVTITGAQITGWIYKDSSWSQITRAVSSGCTLTKNEHL